MKFDIGISYENDKVIMHGVYAANEEIAKLIAKQMYVERLRAQGNIIFHSMLDKIIINNVKLVDSTVEEINIYTNDKIIMAFTDPVDGDENPYKYFTDNFTGEGVHVYFIFNTPEEFITKWLEIYDKPNGMWYWVLDKGKLICSGACDPDDIEIFKEHWGLE